MNLLMGWGHDGVFGAPRDHHKTSAVTSGRVQRDRMQVEPRATLWGSGLLRYLSLGGGREAQTTPESRAAPSRPTLRTHKSNERTLVTFCRVRHTLPHSRFGCSGAMCG